MNVNIISCCTSKCTTTECIHYTNFRAVFAVALWSFACSTLLRKHDMSRLSNPRANFIDDCTSYRCVLSHVDDVHTKHPPCFFRQEFVRWTRTGRRSWNERRRVFRSFVRLPRGRVPRRAPSTRRRSGCSTLAAPGEDHTLFDGRQGNQPATLTRRKTRYDTALFDGTSHTRIRRLKIKTNTRLFA